MAALLFKIFIIIVCLTVAVAAGGIVWWFEYYRSVSFEDFAPDKAQLIDGIESYVRAEDFLKDLNARAVAYDVKWPEPWKDSRPPFNMTTVKISQFSHLGSTGDLSVSFFNNRLSAVHFFPLDLDGYRQQLLSQRGIDLIGQSEVRIPDNTRVWLATEHTGKRYVGWEDIRLTDEIFLWIKRYS